MPRITEENRMITPHNPVRLGNTRILTTAAQNPARTLGPIFFFSSGREVRTQFRAAPGLQGHSQDRQTEKVT